MPRVIAFVFFPRRGLIAVLMAGVKDWLLGQHAKLRRQPSRRQAKVALTEPRPDESAGGRWDTPTDNARNPVPPTPARNSTAAPLVS